MAPAILALLSFLPVETLHACAVCFGTKNTNILSAYMWGTGILMGATMAIIAYWLLIWGVRSPLRIVLTSGIGTGTILFIFVKVGYLALPKGVGPFHEFTIWLFRTLHLF